MRSIKFLSRLLGYMSAVMLGLLMMITVVDVICRYIFNAPLTGATEISELLMVLVVFLSLAWVSVERSHIRVDLLVNMWPRKVQLVVEVVTLLLSLSAYLIITWQSAQESMDVKETTSLLRVPEAPFHWVMTLGLAMLCLAIICHVIDNAAAVIRGEKG